ncbi:MAG: adenine deaminase [Gudongella sp.]|jgi:adenine deaminase|nr:adenine deaminase [Gudongella sp.]
MNKVDLLKRRIDVAKGKIKAELVLKNCKIVNVFTHTITEGDIAIDSGMVVGIGDYDGEINKDVDGGFVAPGFIDSHMHLESAMVTPEQLASVVVPMGTTTIITDPHEIANVCGIEGIRFMMDSTKNLPLNVLFMIPSCVPSSEFETSGARIEAEDISRLIDDDRVLGLGEMMDYPGLLDGNHDVIKKIDIASDKVIDGHSPEVSGKDLNAYLSVRIKTDHEASYLKEMEEKLSLGMYIAIREGSAARDLEVLLPAINSHNERRTTFCTDDKHPADILKEGHINFNLKKAVSLGLDPITAIRMATINAAECYNLKDLGAIAPGYAADIVVLEDLEDFKAIQVYRKGVLVAENGEFIYETRKPDTSSVGDTVHIRDITTSDLEIKPGTEKIRVMRMHTGLLSTEMVIKNVNLDEEGRFSCKDNTGLLKIAVIERHGKNGNVGLGIVENLNLKGGAVGLTIAHDTHNLIVAGDNDEDMILVADRISQMKGGIAVASGGRIQKELALPVAGLMSNEPMEYVAKALDEISNYLYDEMNVPPGTDPLMTLSFIALPVIPEIKLTDMGLFDVNRMKFVGIGVEE